MGLLKVAGKLLTYNEYKDQLEKHKMHGLKQFKSGYLAHKDKYIELKDLKWGEEMEYSIYKYDAELNMIKLSSRGPELIQEFNSRSDEYKDEVVLMPEFGCWMVEAVPTKPYNSLVEPIELLSVEDKLDHRRNTLDKFFTEYDL